MKATDGPLRRYQCTPFPDRDLLKLSDSVLAVQPDSE